MVFKIDTKEAVIEILYQIKNKALNDIIRYPTRTGTCSRVAFMSSFTIFFLEVSYSPQQTYFRLQRNKWLMNYILILFMLQYTCMVVAKFLWNIDIGFQDYYGVMSTLVILTSSRYINATGGNIDEEAF